MSLEDLDALLPSENIFKQPEAVSQFPFPALDIPEFSHFPIENGNFGDLEFLDLASDRLLNKSKNAGQFSDIYFNSLATPSGYCSANFLTEEANRLSLLLSESGEKEKGEVLDKSLIENLEDIFGVGANTAKQSRTIDEQLPNVMGPIEAKTGYDVEFEVPNDVLNIMAKNFETLEELNQSDGRSEDEEEDVSKTITIKSVQPHLSSDPPPGAVAKIILNSSQRLDTTKITFSSIDDKEQHSFSLNTSNMRKAAECLRRYNLDNMDCLRKLLRLGPRKGVPRRPNDARNLNAVSVAGPRRSGMQDFITGSKNGETNRHDLYPSEDRIDFLDKKDTVIDSEGVAVYMLDTVEKNSMALEGDPGGGVEPRVKSHDPAVAKRKDAEAGIRTSGPTTLELSKYGNAAKQLQTELVEKGINVDINVVQVDGQMYFCCPGEECKKAYSTVYELKLHIMNHYNLKPFQCDEPGCSWSFVTAFKLNRHKKTHTKVKDFPCTYNSCQKKFSTMYNLTIHLKSHGKPSKFSCDVCSERFSNFKSLNDHAMRSHPAKSKPGYSCDFPGCDKNFSASKHLNAHKKFHSNEILICKFENCGKQFSKLSHLRGHEISHSEERTFVCDHINCEAKFKTSSKLQRHKKIHDKSNALICDICDKKIYRKEHFKSHYLTHSSEKTLQCVAEFCDKKFAGKVLLYSHIRKVHGKGKEKTSTLLCPISECSQRFVSRKSFQTHLSSHGKDIQDNLISESQDSSQLDFVALLSSVGEDILLPDELACPEYEITSDLVEKNRIGSSLDHSQGEESQQFPLFTTAEGMEDGVAKLVLPDEEGGGEILISIQPQIRQEQDELSISNHPLQTSTGDSVLHQLTAKVNNSSIPQNVISEFPQYEEVGMLIDGVDVEADSVDDSSLGQTLKIPFSMTSQIEGLTKLTESTATGHSLVEADVIHHTLDDIVNGVTYAYMGAPDQTSGLGMSKVGEEICLVESAVNHSTINLQDLK